MRNLLTYLVGLLFVLFTSTVAAQDTIDVFTTDTFALCSSEPLVLSGSGSALSSVTAYQWNTGDSTATITVQASGLYSVSVLNATDTLVDSVWITLDTIISLTIADTVVCSYDTVVTLQNYLQGGYWGGSYVTNDTFNLAAAGGAGDYSLIYYAVNGVCTDTNFVDIRVLPLPSVSLNADTITFCSKDDNLLIDASLYAPAGGIWSGSGVVNGQGIFSPQTAGGLGFLGQDTAHILTYTIVDTLGCVNEAALTVNVVYGDTLIFNRDTLWLCREAGLDTLSNYLIASGTGIVTWVGNGIVNSSLGIFDPQLFNVSLTGANMITVQQEGQHCIKIDSIAVMVRITPVVNAGENRSVCYNQGQITLTGFSPIDYVNGYWQGAGIIDSILGVFQPTISGVGLHTLTYKWENPVSNCFNSDVVTINVLAPPTVVVSPAMDTICNRDNILLSDYFSISPQGAGGTWIGQGVSAAASGVFSPNNTTVGGVGANDYVLTYIFTDENYCSDTAQIQLTTSNGAVVYAGIDTSLCLNGGQVELSGLPAGGSWASKLQGLVSPLSNTYNPLLVGGGVADTLIYTYNDSICINRDTALIYVNNAPVVQMSTNDRVCSNASGYFLSGQSPLGGIWYNSSGITNPMTGFYIPSNATNALDSVYYTYVDVTGCSETVLKTIIIDTVPNISVNAIDDFYYKDDSPVLLVGLPQDGTFYSAQPGVALTNAGYVFSPQSANLGFMNILFSYTDDNNCTQKDTQTIEISNRFQNLSNSVEALSNSAMDWGDYNNDGFKDLVITGVNQFGARKTLIYDNINGTLSLNAAASNTLPQVDNGDVRWGDYNNDGYLDLIITGSVANSPFPMAQIYENRLATGGFFVADVSASAVLSGVRNSRNEWFDIDNDGDLDLIVMGRLQNNDGSTIIYENKIRDGGGFPIRNTLEPMHSGGLSVGDYDADGYKDLALIGYSTASNTAKTVVYKNVAGTFSEISTAVTALQDSDISFGDYDNDGDLDILVIGLLVQSNSRVTRLFENSNGIFINVSTGANSLQGVDRGRVKWGDFDNDGDLDILLQGKRNISDAGYSVVYSNNMGDTLSNSAFTLLALGLISTFGGDVQWVDADNDGDLDIVLSGSQSTVSNPQFRIYNNRNELKSLNNTPPSTPNNLQSTVYVETGSVELSWQVGFDNSTPSNVLTNNIVIGQTFDGQNITTPMSNLSSGYRKIVGEGNVGNVNFVIMSNLPEGKHYWRVQSIDNNFDGSQFSVVDSFDVRRIRIDSIIHETCAGSTIPIQYTAVANTYFNSNNLFSVEMSSVSDNFLNSTVIGTSNSDTSGFIQVTIPEATPTGNYMFRIKANSPLSVSLPYDGQVFINGVSGFEITTIDNKFCEGNSTLLSTTQATNYLYTWSINNTLIASSGDSTVYVSDTGVVKLVITTNYGCKDSTYITTAYHPTPIPSFTIANSCLFADAIPINTSNIGAGGTISNCQWQFGDGTTQVGCQPTHSYNSVDTFVIKLIVTSDNSCQDSTFQEIIVHPNPTANFTVPDNCFGDNTIFQNTSQNPSYGNIQSYLWNLGDGSPSTDENPIHSYGIAGTFLVSLQVTSDKGCVNTYTHSLAIHPLPIPIFFVADECQYNEVTFINNSATILVPVVSFYWEFGDGYVSTQNVPTHRYTVADTYLVRLTAFTAAGCESDTTAILNIHPAPISDFGVMADCTEDYSLLFSDSSYIQSGSIDGHLWHFGDSTFSVLVNPNHTYLEEGNYEVTLITTSNEGCRDTLIVQTPSELLPLADFEFFKEPISLGDTLRPINISQNANYYFWSFGDFNTSNDSDTSTSFNPKYYYTDFGIYEVTLRAENLLGCADSTFKMLKVQQRERSEYEALVYPNPVLNGICTLNIDLKEEVQLNIELYDETGRLAWTFSEPITATPPPDPYDLYSVVLDLSNLRRGVYFVSIIANGERANLNTNISNGPLRGFSFKAGQSAKIMILH